VNIKYIEGDLFTTNARYILHGCNCKGVMGSGVAKAIRSKYPTAYDDYVNVYNSRGLDLGTIILSAQDDGKIIINALTQETYGKTGVHVSYWAVANVFRRLNSFIPDVEVAMPMVGAGLGGGDWAVISAIIEQEAKNYIPVVYKL
jgi:O-acetyl-ADP-ribose deacetylase (regulator of RNase III)